MVLAVNRAVAAGARAVVCASTGNTVGIGGSLRRGGRAAVPRDPAGRQGGARQAGPGARRRSAPDRWSTATSTPRSTAVRRLGEEGLAVVVNSINPDRLEGQQTAACEVVDDARPRARCAGAAGRQRRQHHGLLARVPPLRGRGTRREPAADARLPGRGRRADRARRAGGVTRDGRHRDPDRQSGVVGGRGRGAGRVGRPDRSGHR